MANSRVNRYALADVEVSIAFPSNFSLLRNSGLPDDTPLIIGGPGENKIEGSYVGQITVKRNKPLWSTEGDATGSWVHSKNLDRTGTISIDITQVSEQIVTLVYICSAYESVQEDVDGLTIEVKNTATQKVIASCVDCYITQIPDHSFKETADKYTFEFTCGRILFYQN